MEANTHLREQTKKRDQIVLFYIVVFWCYLQYGKDVSAFMKVPLMEIAIFVSVIGCLCIHMMVCLRYWHLAYIFSIRTISPIIMGQQTVTSIHEYQQYLASTLQHFRTSYKTRFCGVEMMIIWVQCLLTSLVGATIFESGIPYHSVVLFGIFIFLGLSAYVILMLHHLVQGMNSVWLMNFHFPSSQPIQPAPLWSVQSRYHTLYFNANHSWYAVCHTGGVVIAPFNRKNNLCLIQIKRITGAESWELPRGFIEKEELPSHAVFRELLEETGLHATCASYGGELHADTGLLVDHVSLFSVIVADLQPLKHQYEEYINDVKWFNMHEIHKMIASGLITDNFTLSALCLLENRKNICSSIDPVDQST